MGDRLLCLLGSPGERHSAPTFSGIQMIERANFLTYTLTGRDLARAASSCERRVSASGVTCCIGKAPKERRIG